ncbi:MAG: Rieske (2Fe-2S) protein [Gammaproteobacteria bacterium]|nr:Rieske (2Fe-2S) protein [Gammaproteobacteria bacterium]
MTDKHDICSIDDIPDPGSKEFVIGEGQSAWYGFVVKKDGEVFAYANTCPHTGAMLNWAPDRFLTKAGDRIMCGVHGAIFEIETGYCEMGPCKGQSLRDMQVSVEDGRVMVHH